MSTLRPEERSSYGWRGFNRPLFSATVALVIPLGTGFITAVGAATLVTRQQNMTDVLMVAPTLLAISYVPYVVDILGADQRKEHSRSLADEARVFVGIMAALALLLIIIYLVTKDDGDTSRGLPDFGTNDLGIGHSIRFVAVMFTTASLVWSVSIRSVRSWLGAPDPPVLLSTRLCIASCHLLLPSAVVSSLLLWVGACVGGWPIYGLFTLAILILWQVLLTQIRFAAGLFCRGVRIVNARRGRVRLDSQPSWWQSLLRAVILGSSVALPVGIATSLARTARGGEIDSLLSSVLVILCLLPAMVLLISTAAHPRGQGIHDLLAGTAVVRVEQDLPKRSELLVWRPYW